MTKFNSHNGARILIGKICETSQVHFTNEGFEVLFTSEDTNQRQLANSLKQYFQNVKVTNKKVKTIEVKFISQKLDGIRITEVEY
jgi:hypothetical protein